MDGLSRIYERLFDTVLRPSSVHAVASFLDQPIQSGGVATEALRVSFDLLSIPIGAMVLSSTKNVARIQSGSHPVVRLMRVRQ